MKKKTILIFIDWFLPGFKAGGPIQSVSNLIESTSSIFNFLIVTSDRDLGDEAPYPIDLNTWSKKDKFEIIYLSPEKRTKDSFEDILKKVEFDLVYFNSFFSKEFTITPLQLINKKYKHARTVIAPRGMLGEGALNIKKAKKKVFITTAKIIGLYKNVEWHATTSEEKLDILNIFPNNKKTTIAENIAKKQTPFTPRNKNSNELKLIFVSRIAEKKNLLFAIQLLSEIKCEGKITFDIFGPIEEPTYWQNCLKLSKNLPSNIQFSYKGELEPSEISSTFEQYHFFIFPTLHENFGHVIYESLAAGCPVILSNNTPWRELKEKNIGEDISLEDRKKFKATILNFLQLNNVDYLQMSKAAHAYISENINNENNINQYINLFGDE